MTLRAVRNRSLADEVFSQLIGEILRGRYKPGENLPPERTLTEVFRVNRHVVREALKRLAQMEIVAISQGGGTKVLDYKLDGGLDLLPWMGKHVTEPREILMLWRDVLEMRAAIAIDMVRLCTRRASQEVRDDISAIATELAASADDPARLYELEVRFWYRVVDGCGNQAYRLALNSVLKSGTVDVKQTHVFAAWETKDAGFRVELAKAIASGDEEAAEGEVRRTMRSALTMFYKMFLGGLATMRSTRPRQEKKVDAAPSE